jgi:DNA (cytosine-5)-methyltransferase 1
MRYLSVCSGIEAATVAWHDLGWQPVGFSEIEPFPSAVLAHHYPGAPNLGDMTNYKEWNIGAIDLVVGGTPCQSFSVAGLRKGLEDPRGNLALVYCGILDHFRPQWCVWENVPGVLSSNGGRDFGSFLGALAELGYGFAYRVLDAQYFGVAQRRRRVFVVGHLGDWQPAAKVLFESESLRRDTAPSRQKGQTIAPTVVSGPPFSRTGNERVECEAIVVQPITAVFKGGQGSGAGGIGYSEHVAPTLSASDGGNRTPTLLNGMAVRRLTPIECERLQGFPDDYTAIPWRGKETPDGPRYKALGNSMAVPVMQWIGGRINAE